MLVEAFDDLSFSSGDISHTFPLQEAHQSRSRALEFRGSLMDDRAASSSVVPGSVVSTPSGRHVM
jgi:hypothetical protein